MCPPVYELQDAEIGLHIAVEAPSEKAARLHLTRRVSAKVLNAKELAKLVREGVEVQAHHEHGEDKP